MNDSGSDGAGGLKHRPPGAAQHVTAGPYSPVLEVDARRIVVLSGQVAVALDGTVVGDTIEDQAQATLANCARLLAAAGCGLADVFKVNVYLTNLADWPAFNTVYRDAFPEAWPEPWPVRTAVQAALLPGFLVEIEMWAVKREG